jgi:hypothetical protein
MKRDGRCFTNAPSFPARFRKRDSFYCAIASDTRDSAEQRVASDLTRNTTPVELQDDSVLRYLAKVIGIRLQSLDQPEFPFGKFKFA